jgi:hypothetical protein
MKRLTFFLAIICFTTNSYAAKLLSSDAQLIEAAGVPLYSAATFIAGDKKTGYRFTTSASHRDVRRWYQQQLPKWALLHKFGVWFLYNGDLGADMRLILSKNQISVEINDKLSESYDVAKNVTTEIVIKIVD